MNDISREPPSPSPGITPTPGAPLDPPGSAPPAPGVPWTGFDLFIVFVFAYVLWRSIVPEVLRDLGFFDWYYSPAHIGVTLDDDTLKLRKSLWTPGLSFPFQLASILGFLALFRQVTPSDVGLNSKRLGRNIRLGIGIALLVTPIVLGLQFLIVWLHQHVFGVPTKEHPLAELGRKALTPAEWSLWLTAAVIAAPVLEELLLRGLFQPWAAQREYGGWVGVVLAGTLAVTSRTDAIEAARRAPTLPQVLSALAPLIFVALMTLVLLAVRSGSRGRALFGTALLFAMLHTSVWPAPIALLVLALALGWLRERTGGLVAPIVLHGVFNGVSCAMLLLGWA
jgi:membrane protease YdiL (CAAX protease family)